MRSLFLEFYYLVYHVLWLCCQLLPETTFWNRVRGLVISPFLKSCGKNLQVGTGVKVIHPFRLIVGDHVYVGTNTWIFCAGIIEIGSETLLGSGVNLVSSNHTYDTKRDSPRFSKSTIEPIIIGDRCWLGGGTFILGGSNIGNGSIVAAGAVVNGVLEPDSIYGGVPARKLKKRK